MYALYRPRLAPTWLRLLTLGMKHTLKPVIGYCLCCPHSDCGAIFCLGDGGPRDTWRPHPNALGGRSAPQPGRARSSPPPAEEEPPRDPAEGSMMRTLADRR